jgi:uncharacterized RDD family membrane protein YckC/ribosomal protein L40E
MISGQSEDRCPNCDGPLAEEAIFCTGCGVRLQYQCQTCYTLNSFGASFCRQCGSSLSTSAGDPGPASPPRTEGPANASSCQRCGNVNEPGALFCYSCGLPIDEGQVRAVPLFPAGRPAGFWIRLLAWAIDVIVLIAVELVLIAILPGVSFEESGADGLSQLISLIVSVLYFTFSVSIWATTIGKRIVGTYVLRPDGSKAGVGRAFARYWAHVPSTLLLLGGYLMVAFRQDKRALHDLICDTVVVYRR